MVARGCRVEKMGRCWSRVQTLRYKMNKSGDLMYSKVMIVNNTVLLLEICKRVDFFLSILTTYKKSNCVR